MDGNGRWAQRRGLPRLAGHRAGAGALRRLVEAAPQAGIGTLTLYAFSSDNWRRPAEEVSGLMALLHSHLLKETEECAAKGVRISLIGRRDRLPPLLIPAVEAAEKRTAGGRNLHLRLAIDYSSRDAIMRAAARITGPDDLTREGFARLLNEPDRCASAAPDVDLLIRTGGEQRLSDFLLWECAYAEFFFTDRMWPDFGAEDLQAALGSFRGRERRFGAVPKAAAG